MPRHLIIALAAAAAFSVLVACRQDPSVGKLQIDFEWAKKNECSEVSPEIRITGLPQDAERLKVRLIDLYQPGADHGDWGEPIPVPQDRIIPRGGLRHFRGPCPPKYYGQSNYEFTVKALDNEGTLVAEGSLAKKCCPDW